MSCCMHYKVVFFVAFTDWILDIICFTFSIGILTTMSMESISRPKNVILVLGPSFFLVAIGIPNLAEQSKKPGVFFSTRPMGEIRKVEIGLSWKGPEIYFS